MDPVLDDVTRRWVAGWAHACGVGTGEVAGWPIVHVRSVSRAFELVCADPDPATWELLLDDIAGDRTAMLTLASADPAPYLENLPVAVRVDRDDEALMVLAPLRSRVVPDVPGYAVQRDSADRLLTLRLTRDGQVAAEGTAGVLGGDAVFDRIETTPAFRRRGLATWVMAELTQWAESMRATTGLLAASPAGAALYRGLGWREVASLRSLTGA
jgi:GNAT superfamily N-acetyltransferase